MSQALKMYPSGFLGSASVEQTAPVDVVTTARRFFSPGLNPKVNHYLANQKLQDLWEVRHSGAPEGKTFEFCEEVLKAAKEAFGTALLIDWIATQSASPYYSNYHRDWINETLGFVLDRKVRQLSANAWFYFLNVDQPPCADKGYSRIVRHYLLGEKLHSEAYGFPYRANMTVVEFIGLWCARDGGFADMLDQLHNVFGKR